MAFVIPVALHAADSTSAYETMPVDESLKKSSTAVNGILMAGRFGDASQQAIFDDFFQKYQLARWTEPKNIASLPKFRQDLSNQLRKSRAGAEVHDHLNALALEFMKSLVTGPYHPAVQVNAVLMIGELNSVESSDPTPLPEALEVLLETALGPKYSDALRAAALVGIRRHVPSNPSDSEGRRAIASAMLKIASAKVPAGPEKRGREWILSQALTILADMRSPGDNNAAYNAMLQVVADSKLSLTTRGIAAESLGKLNYANMSEANPTAGVSALAQFLLDVCSAELQKPTATEVESSRRRLHQFASDAMIALTGDGESKGIASLARDEKQKEMVASMQKGLDTFLASVEDKKSEGKDTAPAVRALQTALEGLAKKS